MYLKNCTLKEQLQDVVDDVESILKQIFENLYIDKKQTERELQDKITALLGQFNEKQVEFTEFLNKVNAHQQRAQHIRALEEAVDSQENLISRMAQELKTIENSLVEATFQAEKKLKSVRQSETNRVFSEEVIRFAHLISKHYSVASSVYWQQGDPSRPFPTEANFSVSNLLLSRTQPNVQAQPFASLAQMHAMKPTTAMFNVPGMPAQQRPFITGQRTGMFSPNMVPTNTGSPRGRPPGSGTRMTSPSPRSFPKILQRSSSQQSPRFTLVMPGQQQAPIASSSPSASSPTVQSQQPPGFMSPSSLESQHIVNSKQPSQVADIPRVEQMSSDSSSSSSSGDEASPDGR